MESAKRIVLAYINPTPRIHDNFIALFQTRLKALFELDLLSADDLSKVDLQKVDLLIFQARMVDDISFALWLEKVERTILKSCPIPVPALFLKKFSFAQLSELYLKAAQQNWYIDILSEAEIESLPIRIANLLRIYDHMRELKRYEDTLQKLQGRVADLESQLIEISRKNK